MFTVAFLCLLYCFGIVASIIGQVICKNIDSLERWNYTKHCDLFSTGHQIILYSVFWVIVYPALALYKAISFLWVKFLVKVFSLNNTKLIIEEKKFIQLQSKDYRTPAKLVKVCSECHRRYDV